MKRHLLALLFLLPIAGCATTPPVEFIPSTKSAVELRAIQSRTVAADADVAMRGIIATLHDLGYRITQVEPEGRTISATRATTLRMAVVVQPRGANESTVRANATIIAPPREAQVDSVEFYQRNFFEPLGATMNRTLAEVRSDEGAPEAVRPVAEVNTARERENAARMRATPVSTNPSAAATTTRATH
jgi:predicted small lipoprotein YifL